MYPLIGFKDGVIVYLIIKDGMFEYVKIKI